LRGRGSGKGRGRGYKSSRVLGGLSRSPNTYRSEKEDGNIEAKGSSRSENEDMEGSSISEKDKGIEAKGSGFYSVLLDVPVFLIEDILILDLVPLIFIFLGYLESCNIIN